MEQYNEKIGCDVRNCRYNAEGKNCTLDHIHVGCACGETCTCCDSYQEK